MHMMYLGVAAASEMRSEITTEALKGHDSSYYTAIRFKHTCLLCYFWMQRLYEVSQRLCRKMVTVNSALSRRSGSRWVGLKRHRVGVHLHVRQSSRVRVVCNLIMSQPLVLCIIDEK